MQSSTSSRKKKQQQQKKQKKQNKNKNPESVDSIDNIYFRGFEKKLEWFQMKLSIPGDVFFTNSSWGWNL